MSDEVEGGGASRTTEPAAGSSSGTDVALREYVSVVVSALDRRSAELRAADLRFHEERDRRYAEVAIEREKALAIKERADETARILVAENQAYRDEKGNELRSQIERERGLYATRVELTAAVERVEAVLAPVVKYVAGQQGERAGIGISANVIAFCVTVLIAVGAVYFGTR